MGSIPIIIADGYKPPLQTKIDWPSISITIQENQLSKLGAWLQHRFPKGKIRDMRLRMQEVYEEYLSPARFERSIELGLSTVPARWAPFRRHRGSRWWTARRWW